MTWAGEDNSAVRAAESLIGEAAHSLSAIAAAQAGQDIAIEAVAGRSSNTYEDLYGPARRARPAAAPARAKSRAPVFQAAAAVLAISAAMGAVAARGAIVAHVPSMAFVYAVIGLPVNARGIAFSDVKSALTLDGENQVLSVEGTMTNLRTSSVTVPEIIASVKGRDGRDVYTWKSPAPKTTLGPGETAAFRTRLAAPPAGAQDVVLRFANAEDPVRTRDKSAK